MDEKLLNFDREKHILYSKNVKSLILDKLNKRYSKEEATLKWDKIQNQYVSYLSTLPYLGGKGCRHNGVGGTYDCIALFSYYQVEKDSIYLSDTKKAIDELYEMNNALFLPSFARMGKILNVNSYFGKRILHLAFKITAKVDAKIAKKSVNNSEEECSSGGYIMKVPPLKDNRVYYHFDRCPIAEFAKKNNLLHIMPSFCNGDYPALSLVHASLIRNHTCANSSSCDFLIVGDKSNDAKSHPKKILQSTITILL